MNPVWVLSVDLQTKTATFQSGLSDAAKSARGAFSQIKSGAGEMGRDVSGSMTEARHGVILLGEEFGVHLPRGITSFITSIGPVGAAMEAAFPYLAIILGATLLIENIVKLGDAQEKAAEAARKLSDSMRESLDKVEERIVDSEIKIRELAKLPDWDLLAEKLKLNDAKEGVDNIKALDTAVKTLLEDAKASSNWNPLNWLDNSDISGKVKAFQEQMHGKDQNAQLGASQGELKLQTDILEQHKRSGDISDKELSNSQKYVNFLGQEVSLLQSKADADVLADQAKQGKDVETAANKRIAEAKRAAEAERAANNAVAAAQLKGWELLTAAHKKLYEVEDKNANDLDRTEEFRINAGLKAEQKAADEKVKIAEKAAKEAEKNAKDQEHLYERLDKMAAEAEAKKFKTIEAGEKRIAETFNSSFARTIVEGKNFGQAMTQMGSQMLQELIQQELMYIEKKFIF